MYRYPRRYDSKRRLSDLLIILFAVIYKISQEIFIKYKAFIDINVLILCFLYDIMSKVLLSMK